MRKCRVLTQKLLGVGQSSGQAAFQYLQDFLEVSVLVSMAALGSCAVKFCLLRIAWIDSLVDALYEGCVSNLIALGMYCPRQP